ncbi:M10 family metallopeptidase C-terminal domain-containing protein [Seohaeicola saemankumensis]|nr:M10 family metallopeptidase C-terminal domain-containing protein [Seohaeicola saemankumensis]MCA0873921.1 M10 family metallopeptidase C-terminal domain-containing protein [Seohaeicola saemankumensis]
MPHEPDGVIDYGATPYGTVTAPTDTNVGALIVGRRWTDFNLTYSFTDSASDYGAGYRTNTAGFSALSAQQEISARYWFNQYASVSGLTFTELDGASGALDEDQEATIRMANGTNINPTQTAIGYYPRSDEEAGDIWFEGTGTNPALGNFDWATVGHEIGHALGLAHGHETSGLSTILESQYNFTGYSIMTYLSFVGDNISGNNNLFWHNPQSLMIYDIAATQYLYGANFSSNAGNSTYTFSTSTGEMFINGVGQGTPGTNVVYRTVWDGNGNDTYDLSNYGTNLLIDLRPGNYSNFDVGGYFQRADLDWNSTSTDRWSPGHLFNALQFENDARSLIENAIGGSGNDTLHGNAANNTLTGNGGTDWMYGYDGNDTLNGSGADRMYGGSGNDTLRITAGAFTGRLDGGADADRIVLTGLGSFDLNNTVVQLSSIEEVEFSAANVGLRQFTITSRELDSATEVPTNFRIDFNANGALAVDQFYVFVTVDGAGTGNVDASQWIIQDYESFDLIQFAGDGTSNNISGTSVADSIHGNNGNDTIQGNEGADSMTGGAGFDTLSYTNSGAGITVNMHTGTGTGGDAQGDTFNTFERVVGSVHNDYFNRGVINNAFSYTFEGGAGNDGFQIGGIADIVLGGTGNDILWYQANHVSTGASYDGGADTDQFRIFGGAGTVDMRNDTVTNFETLSFTDQAFDMGARFTAAQISQFSTFATDAHFGYTRDVFIEMGTTTYLDLSIVTVTGFTGVGDDIVITGDASYETILTSTARDIVNANGGNDTIHGSLGADTLNGGTGIDTLNYSASNAGVTVNMGLQTASGGHATGDTISGFESVVGSAHNDSFNGYYSGSNYTYDGGGGHDYILAFGTADTVLGGSGNDTIVRQIDLASIGATLNGGTDSDTLRVFAGAVGVGDFRDDTVSNFETLTMEGSGFSYGVRFMASQFTQFQTVTALSHVGHARHVVIDMGTMTVLDLSGLTVSGFIEPGDDFAVNGGASGETITGSSATDLLIGGGGNDILTGSGSDQLFGETDNDTLRLTAGVFDGRLDGGIGNDKLLLSGAGVFDLDETGLRINSLEEIEFEANSGNSDKTLVITSRELDQASEVPANLIIDFNASGANGEDELRVIVTSAGGGTGNIDASGWVIQDYQADFDTLRFDGDGTGNTIIGTSVNDIIFGGAGTDTLNGFSGNDVIEGGAGADVINGGTGVDTASYANSGSGIIITINSGSGALGDASGDTLSAIENVIGSAFSDIISGDDLANRIEGRFGNDILIGYGGVDVLLGGGDADTLIAGFASSDLVAGETFDGGSGTDSLLVSTNGDEIFDYRTSVLTSLETLNFDSVSANLTARFNAAQIIANFVSVIFPTSSGFTRIADITMDAVTSLNLSGLSVTGLGSFLITGDASSETIIGTSAADTINGNSGDDIINGGAGNDILDGGLGTGVDTVNGDAGNDTLVHTQLGTDSFDGGADIDTLLSDVDWADSVSFKLNGGVIKFGGLNYDTLTGIENVTVGGGANVVGTNDANVISATDTGTEHNNTFSGLGGDDTLDGGIGNDRLIGGSGNDILIGGDGLDVLVGGKDNDTLTGGDDKDLLKGGQGIDILDGGGGGDKLVGGSEADTFVWDDVLDSQDVKGLFDKVKDFVQLEDTADLSGIDAITGGGDDAFTLIGASAFSGTAGELRYEHVGSNTFLLGDVDGDGVADLKIVFIGTYTFVASDFVL